MSVSKLSARLSLAAGIFAVLGTSISGCGGGGSSTPVTPAPGPGTFVTPGTTPFVNASLASRAVCQANPHQAGRVRWTVLVYINAANNLQPFSLINVAQMASVGSNANLNIVVQWKQTTTSNFFTGAAIDTTPSFVGTRRYLLRKHSQADLNRIAPSGIETNAQLVGDTTVLDPDRLADPATDTLNDGGNPTADMGSYQTLGEFVQWGAKTYPADHLAVVVWDHGSGSLNVDNRSIQKMTRMMPSFRKATRGLSQDVQTGSQIATQQMPLALANPPQAIDDLIIDCSLEGTAEMAFDCRNSAKVYVASEESPPGRGYPYDVWLTFLQNSVASPCDAGQNLINDTVAAYPSASDITQSMTDLTKMNAVATSLNAFGGILRNDASSLTALIKTARQSSQFFEFVEYKDLYDFANAIRTASGAPSDLAQAAANVQTSLYGTDGAILASSHGTSHDTSGVGEDRASGMSIFLPGPQTQSSVDNTVGFDPAWLQVGLANAAPNWAAFLQAEVQ